MARAIHGESGYPLLNYEQIGYLVAGKGCAFCLELKICYIILQ